jgi:hypothetical protein
LSRVDELIEKLRKGEPIPSIEDMVKGKAWKIARVPVPKFVCEVVYASGVAWSMEGDVPWDTRSYVRKARPNSIALEKRNLGTHMRAKLLDSDFQS